MFHWIIRNRGIMNRIRLWVHGTVTMPVKWHWRCHLVVRWETIVKQGSNYGCSRHDTEPALGVHKRLLFIAFRSNQKENLTPKCAMRLKYTNRKFCLRGFPPTLSNHSFVLSFTHFPSNQTEKHTPRHARKWKKNQSRQNFSKHKLPGIPNKYSNNLPCFIFPCVYPITKHKT